MPKPELRDALRECLEALAEQQRLQPETPPVPTRPATMADLFDDIGRAMAVLYLTDPSRAGRRR